VEVRGEAKERVCDSSRGKRWVRERSEGERVRGEEGQEWKKEGK